MTLHHRIALLSFCWLVGCASAPISHAAPKTPARNSDAQKLRLASSRWSPFTDVPGQPRVALELVSEALSRAGYEVSQHILPEGMIASAVQEGSFDGASAMWPSPERAEFLLYSEPYLENRIVLVGKKGSDVSARSFAELAGKRIGVVDGYAYGPEFEQAKGPVFVAGTSTEENLRGLLAGDLDYVLEDALVTHHLLEQYQQAQASLEVAKRSLFRRTLHLTLRKDVPNAQTIIERFNAQIIRMEADGTYNTALHVDWIRADVDGDGRPELISVRDSVGSAPPTTGHYYDLLSTVPARTTSEDERYKPRFLIEGVYYDTWDQVPDEYKKNPHVLGPKPGTLRIKAFEF